MEGEIAKAQGDGAAIDSLRRQLASELASIEEKREARKDQVRTDGHT